MKHSIKKRRNKNNWKVLVFEFFGLTALVLLTMGLIRGINQSQWKEKSWFGIIRQDQEIEVMLVSLEQKKLVKLLIPEETMVKVSFGFGEYRLGKVFQLGELEKKPGLILTRTAQDWLGLPISGWQVNNQSNLTWWDKLRLGWFEKFGGITKETIDLKENLALQPSGLSDQSVVFRTNQVLLDQILHEQIFNQQLADEGLSVAVLNASGVDGIANNISRLASNLGVEVRLITNTVNQASSVIMVNDKKIKNSLTVRSLRQALKLELTEVVDTFEYRSDIVLLIGQDYTKL